MKGSPLLSVIIPARNGHAITMNCLYSCARTFESMRGVEFILLDDASGPEHRIGELFDWLATITKHPVIRYRSERHMHYTGSFFAGMTAASADNLFLLSNDMQLPPAFIEKLLAVSAMSSDIGIVRGRSAWTDSHPEHQLSCPIKSPVYDDVCRFSRAVSAKEGMTIHVDNLLSGDAVLIKRSVIDAIGHFDRQFFGYFGDLDYGIRAQRAGFSLVCARGAWLHHEGGGHIVHGPPDPERHAKRMALVQTAYDLFRAKWCPEAPAKWVSVRQLDFDLMRSRGPLPGSSDTIPDTH